MNKVLDNRAWLLVLPVLLIVAFRRCCDHDRGQLFVPGHLRQQQVLLERRRLVQRTCSTHSTELGGRFFAALGRNCIFSAIILLIECARHSRGIDMPRQGWGVRSDAGC